MAPVPRWKWVHEAEPDDAQTSFSFIDVLFGLVIAVLFEHFADWRTISWVEWLHLFAGAALVLGSYIGYRKSRNHTGYKLFFFNLPLFRFLLDQSMVALYFRFAMLTSGKGEALRDSEIVVEGLDLLVTVFVLYVLWDLLSWRMSRRKYKLRDNGGKERAYDPTRVGITILGLVALLALRCLSDFSNASCSQLVATELSMIAVLVGYRVLKDARS